MPLLPLLPFVRGAPRALWKIVAASLLYWASLTHAQLVTATNDIRLLVDYSARPEPRSVLAHNFCILDPAAEAPLAEGRAMGHTHLAYISTVEVIPSTPAAQKAKVRRIPLLDQNTDWNSSVLDLTHPEWEDWLVEDMVRPAIQKGYDGVFLDTIDSMMRVIMKDPSQAPACYKAMASVIQRIHRQFPGKLIVLNRGFKVVEDVSTIIDGVLVEGLYQTWSPEKKTYQPTGIEGSEWLLHHIERTQSHKLPVFVVDYVAPADGELARTTAKRIRAKGCIPFVTTPELHGEELAPLREVPRRVAVLHGGNRPGDGRASIPADTLTTELLQSPLEWLGYEAEYFDVSKGTPPNLSSLRYGGIIIDEDIHAPVEREEAIADWLIEQRRHGVKLLFTGAIPLSRDPLVRRLFDSLSLRGSNKPVDFENPPSITSPDGSIMTENAANSVPPSECRAVSAPPGARVMLSLQGRDSGGRARRVDPVFLTSWGGALLLRNLPEQSYRRIDLFAFVSDWLDAGRASPVPDVSTRDGMRAFYAHFDGDGFTSRSAIEGNSLCGELIRDRILKAYPLPITVSVIEAEIEAHVTGVDRGAAAHYREVARGIYALPNVQAASHTYSHPFQWLSQGEAGGKLRDSPSHLELKPWANYSGEIIVDREVRGSIEYINRVLAPRDKQVEMLLWSGDCRPGPDALRLCREMGVESMNGAKMLSRHYPALRAIPPSHTFWSGEMQVFAAGQNEFMCGGRRPAPFFESSENVIANFEGTGSPRRLKPVNPCGDFRDGAYLSSVKAMQKVFGWCMEQPLHAITARQYAQTVRDAAATRVYEKDAERWLVSNAGYARTFRLPAASHDPDMVASRGVTGWIRHNDSLYVHTRGEPLTELVLNARPAPHLRLAECSAEIEFRTLAALRAEFRVTDLRPVQAVFAGVPPHAACDLVVNGKSMRAQSDGEGIVKLHLPSTADVTLDFSTARLANRN